MTKIILNFILEDKKYLLDIFVAIFTAISAIAAYIAARNSAKSSEIQSKIDLYDARYRNIYEVFFDFLEKEKDLYLKDDSNIHQNTWLKDITNKLTYAQFLIKEKDKIKILNLCKSVDKLLIDFYFYTSKKYNASYSDIDKLTREDKLKYEELKFNIEKKEKEFLRIIVPYLQIEKESIFKRLYLSIKNLFKKK
ncbi:MAG: hypothetical protein IKP65_08270 [Alphaproteobacteria bacterium]|nr:hypothetical protein [Alphaproteobacteria bacterium]